MGDRANIAFRADGSEKPPIHFYTHWSGGELPKILQSALIRGQERWSDSSYLARIVFSELIKNEITGLTGYGLSIQVGDGDSRVLLVDPEKPGGEVQVGSYADDGTWIGKKSWTFHEYMKLLDGELNVLWKYARGR